MQKEREE
jgi:hypothetical protein